MDFKLGYSPERINPGAPVHRLENKRKIVSGLDAESPAESKAVCDRIIEAKSILDKKAPEHAGCRFRQL